MEPKPIDAELLPAKQEPQAPAGPLAIISKAIELKDLSIDVLKELRAMWKEEKADAAREAFNSAMAAFQAECPPIPKGKTAHGKKFDYNYAPLPLILATVRASMEKHGLSHAFHVIEQTKESITVACEARHSAGHSESCQFTAPIDPEAYMNAIQTVGSSMSYAERYTFCGVFGIAPGDSDDDGKASDPKHAAGDHPRDKRKSKPTADMPPCPKCDKGNRFVKRSKYDGEEFYCYKKIGGCGAKFDAAPANPISEPTPDPEDEYAPDDTFDGDSEAASAAQEPPGAQDASEVDSTHPQGEELLSAAQKRAIWSIAAQLGYSKAVVHKSLMKYYNKDSVSKLTKAEAHETIDKMKVKQAEAEAAEEAKAKAAKQAADKNVTDADREAGK